MQLDTGETKKLLSSYFVNEFLGGPAQNKINIKNLIEKIVFSIQLVQGVKIPPIPPHGGSTTNLTFIERLFNTYFKNSNQLNKR